MMTKPEDVLSYWFGAFDAPDYPQAKPEIYWGKSAEIDADIREKFGDAIEMSARGELAAWREAPHGLLAHIILIDQMTRNMYRDTAEMYAQDNDAQELSLLGVEFARPFLTHAEQQFLLMPLMHAENVALQRLCVRLFEEIARFARPADREAAENVAGFARKHAVIVERFGRFPHRNEILGRETTPEEAEFLTGPDSSF